MDLGSTENVPWNFMGLWIWTKFHGIPWNLRFCCLSSTEFHGTTCVFKKVPSNSGESSMELFDQNIFWNLNTPISLTRAVPWNNCFRRKHRPKCRLQEAGHVVQCTMRLHVLRRYPQRVLGYCCSQSGRAAGQTECCECSYVRDILCPVSRLKRGEDIDCPKIVILLWRFCLNKDRMRDHLILILAFLGLLSR